MYGGFMHSVVREKKKAEPETVEPNDFENEPTASELPFFNPRPYVGKLLRKYKIKFQPLVKKGRFFVYDKSQGIWSTGKNPTMLIDELRRNVLPIQYRSTGSVNQVLEDLKSFAPKINEVVEPDWWFIPFNDGYYNLKTEEFNPHEPEMFFISKLGVNFNPKAKCPTVDRIFSQVVEPQNVIDLYETIGYTFVRCYYGNKIIVMYGIGDNGKSVVLSIIRETLGKENTSATPLYDLQYKNFSSAELFGKFANFSSESDPGDLDGKNSKIKQITGGDAIQAEKKFRDPFQFVNYAKLFWSMNRIPETSDKSLAFYRRVHLIRFPYVFEGKKKDDRTLLDKIPPEEHEGLAFKCLGYLKRLAIDNNFHFTNETPIHETETKYEKLSNPISAFIDEKCIEEDEASIVKSVFRKEFKKWLDHYQTDFRGYQIDDAKIKKEMGRRGIYDLRPRGKGEDEKRPWKWMGVRWK
jgi:putative DNA primase/helicase